MGLDDVRLADASELDTPEERELHAIGNHGARVGGLLKSGGTREERQRLELAVIERIVREEVEVDRGAMPQAQRERGPAVEHVAVRHRTERGPECALGRRQDLEMRGHGGSGLAGIGGGC